MSILIRVATLDDAPALAPILASLHYPASVATIRERLLSLATVDPTGRILVAESEGRLLGFASLHCTPTLHRPTLVGRITGLAVVRESRGTGAGRLLVEAAERYFSEMALTRVEVTSGPLHKPAHSFYLHLGYEDQGVRFAKSIP